MTDNDFNNDEQDLDYDRVIYETDYKTELSELLKSLPKEEREAVYQEHMDNYNIKHSDNGMADARKNVIESIKTLSGDTDRGQADDFLEYKARRDNKPLKEVKKWARESLKKQSPFDLGGKIF